MQKIVIASDSFKGSLSSAEVADAAALAIHKVYPDCEVIKIPVADGGEGTVAALTALTGGKIITCSVHDPYMRLIEANYGVLGNGRTAIIEMSAASGLSLVAPDERNPWLTTTYGTGELILDALQRGCTDLLIGIGGSATNDAGTGMLRALGFVFYDSESNELKPCGGILHKIAYVDDAGVTPLLANATFTIACDVNNPFCGKNGAAYVYGAQKGADDGMIEALDKGMAHFAQVIYKTTNKDIRLLSGAGAAGGLGGAFVAFLNGRLQSGIDMVLEAIGFEQRIEHADLIITGEGRIDAQSCMGKTPVGVLRYAQKKQIPVIAIAGAIADDEIVSQAGFLAVVPLLPAPVSITQAMDKEFTKKNISRTIVQLLRLIQFYKD